MILYWTAGSGILLIFCVVSSVNIFAKTEKQFWAATAALVICYDFPSIKHCNLWLPTTPLNCFESWQRIWWLYRSKGEQISVCRFSHRWVQSQVKYFWISLGKYCKRKNCSETSRNYANDAELKLSHVQKTSMP